MTADDVLALMRAHRTIRRFAPDPVPGEHVDAAVEAARMASTSSHIQAYALLRVTDASERARLAELCGGQPQVAEAGAFFVVAGDRRRHALAAGVDADRPSDASADNLETFLLCAVDASLFAQNLVLAFESMGYGVCYVGGLRNELGAVVELLELPRGVLPFYGLCVGVPAHDPGQRPRLPVRAIWFEERYPSDEAVRALVAEQDAEMARWYAERGKPGHDWSGGVQRRFARRVRETLRAVYERQGAVFE